jgi:putative membrane protein
MPRFAAVRYWEATEPPWDQGDVPWIVRMAVRWGITIAGFLAAKGFVNWLYGRDRFFIDGWEPLLAAAAIFVVLRAVVRPVLLFLTCPLQLITLGLFILVVNAAILLLTEEVAGWFDMNFSIDGFWPAFIGALVISAVSFALSRVLRRNPMRFV